MTLGVPVTYVVSNPSSYGYPDANRPVDGSKEFRAFSDARNCTTYDRWPYGLAGRVGYAARLTDEQMKRQLVPRPTVYLLGGLDILPLAGFDSSCPAMTQVPLCGHNARCMYTAEPARAILFPAR
jgi:hypothetical protein